MSRLAIEVKSGVFVASINARVRDKLWQKITDDWCLSAIMIYKTNNEQGYGILSNGDPDREVLNFDGIQLLARPVKKTRSKKNEEESKNDEELK